MSAISGADRPALEWDQTDPTRWVTHRARYIEQTSEFDALDAEIIALSELGYSIHGITKRVDVTKGTVKEHQNQIDAADETARWTRQPDSIRVSSPVGKAGTVWGDSDE